MIVQFILQLLGCAGLFFVGLITGVSLVCNDLINAAKNGETVEIGDFNVQLNIKNETDK